MSFNLYQNIFAAVKRKIFVSYHHDGDQGYYNEFTRVFSETYDVVQDNSLDRRIDSDNVDYVMQRIRDNCITGTSCTIVLCGAETRWRKYVDWEIKATLDKEHGLIGINLPSNPTDQQGRCHIPDRLNDNIISGYALWTQWSNMNANYLQQCIEAANGRAKSLINNTRQMRARNGA